SRPGRRPCRSAPPDRRQQARHSCPPPPANPPPLPRPPRETAEMGARTGQSSAPARPVAVVSARGAQSNRLGGAGCRGRLRNLRGREEAPHDEVEEEASEESPYDRCDHGYHE